MVLPLANQPRDFLLGDDNDIVIPLQFSTGIQGVTQSCRIILQMFAGEWFLNLDTGIPYWQSILGQKPAIAEKAARIAFRSALQSVSGVLEVLRCDVQYDSVNGRALIVTWQVSTGLGNTPVDTLSVDFPVGG